MNPREVLEIEEWKDVIDAWIRSRTTRVGARVANRNADLFFAISERGLTYIDAAKEFNLTREYVSTLYKQISKDVRQMIDVNS